MRRRISEPVICAGCGYRKNACQCLELALLQHITFHQLPEPEREYVFLPDRKFRADFAYPDAGLLIEVEGGTRGKGGHSTHAGITRDVEKSNLATLNGWRVIRCTGDQVKDGQCVLWIQDALGMEATR